MDFSDLVAVTDAAVQAHLGGTVRYSSGYGGDPIEVPGLFFTAYLVRELSGGGPGVESFRPAFFARSADLPETPDEHAEAVIEYGGTQYRVHERQPDDQGGILLLLAEAY